MARVDLEPDVVGARRVVKGDHVIARQGPYIIMYAWPSTPYVTTPEREVSKAGVRSTGQAWRALTPAQKDLWQRYARKFVSTERPDYGKGWVNGYNMFVQACGMRRSLGLALPAEPLPLDPPRCPDSIAVSLATDPSEFTFTVRHGHGNGAGYALKVRITGPTASIAAKPRLRDAVLICGNNPASTVPLPASGGTVTFTGTRRSVSPGERFGVAVRIIRTADGIASPEMWFDLVRSEPTPEERTLGDKPLREPVPPRRIGLAQPVDKWGAPDAQAPVVPTPDSVRAPPLHGQRRQDTAWLR